MSCTKKASQPASVCLLWHLDPQLPPTRTRKKTCMNCCGTLFSDSFVPDLAHGNMVHLGAVTMKWSRFWSPPPKRPITVSCQCSRQGWARDATLRSICTGARCNPRLHAAKRHGVKIRFCVGAEGAGRPYLPPKYLGFGGTDTCHGHMSIVHSQRLSWFLFKLGELWDIWTNRVPFGPHLSLMCPCV